MADDANVVRCQQRAAEMLALEEAAQTDEAKLLYLKLARQWGTLAEIALLENALKETAQARAQLVSLN